MTQTMTASITSTMTATRVRNVMVEIATDFALLVASGLITQGIADSWRKDLIFIMENEACKSFQVQLKSPDQSVRALEYQVAADGSIRSSKTGGGINFFNIPAHTVATLFVAIDFTKAKSDQVLEKLKADGWGTDGTAVTGPSRSDRAYSSEGYGVRRTLIGDFS